MNCSKFLLLAVSAFPVSGMLATGRADDAPVTPAVVPVASTTGRLLSSTCFQCHSSSGFEGITGESPSEIISELGEMKRRKTPEDIMDLVARGLTDAQIAEIAAYLSTIPENGGDGDEDEDKDKRKSDD